MIALKLDGGEQIDLQILVIFFSSMIGHPQGLSPLREVGYEIVFSTPRHQYWALPVLVFGPRTPLHLQLHDIYKSLIVCAALEWHEEPGVS